jgi:hypothetical protein
VPISDAGALNIIPVAILDNVIIIKKVTPIIRFQTCLLDILNLIRMNVIVVI